MNLISSGIIEPVKKGVLEVREGNLRLTLHQNLHLYKGTFMISNNDDAPEKLAGMENDPDDRLSHYEYMVFYTSIPVCFRVDKDGDRYGASVPGKEKGSLVPDATFLSKYLSETDEFRPIDQNEFEQRVRDFEFREVPFEQSTYAEEIYQQYLAKMRAKQKISG